MLKAEQALMEQDKELASRYRELLKTHGILPMDNLVMEYEEEIKSSQGQLSNERIRHYLGMFSYYSYILNATISRHNLRSDIAELMEEEKNAKAFIETPTAPDAKATRDARQAYARLESVDEAKVAVLFKAVTKAIEGRIWAFNKLIETLNTLSAMNMSEAKLGGRQ